MGLFGGTEQVLSSDTATEALSGVTVETSENTVLRLIRVQEKSPPLVPNSHNGRD